MAGGYHGVGAVARALVSFFGVFLAKHFVFHPKVTAHLEVEAALRTGVALWVTVATVCDPHGLGDNTVATFFTGVLFLNSRNSGARGVR